MRSTKSNPLKTDALQRSFLLLMSIIALIPPIYGNSNPIEQIKDQGFFDLKLTYDPSSHLWKLPVYLGYTSDDFEEPYWCVIDFALPTIIVPSDKCSDCDGNKKFTRRSDGEAS